MNRLALFDCDGTLIAAGAHHVADAAMDIPMLTELTS